MPNLQNQPALEKDRYKIRKAFTCEVGNKLISADYGQLELRILAHISNCRSMLSAFATGGDFHSRTAIGDVWRLNHVAFKSCSEWLILFMVSMTYRDVSARQGGR